MESCNHFSGVEHAAYLHYLQNASIYFGPGCNNGKIHLRLLNNFFFFLLIKVCHLINITLIKLSQNFIIKCIYKIKCIKGYYFLEMLIIGRLATRWNVPIVAHLSGDDALSDRTVFSTLSSVALTSATEMARATLTYLNLYGWKQVY